MSRMMRCEAVVTVTFDDRKLNDLPRSRNQSRSWPVVAPAVNNSCHSLGDFRPSFAYLRPKQPRMPAARKI